MLPLMRWLYRASGYVPGEVDRSQPGFTGYLKEHPSMTFSCFVSINRVSAEPLLLRYIAVLGFLCIPVTGLMLVTVLVENDSK